MSKVGDWYSFEDIEALKGKLDRIYRYAQTTPRMVSQEVIDIILETETTPEPRTPWARLKAWWSRKFWDFYKADGGAYYQ